MRQLWVSLDNSALRELAGSTDLCRFEDEAKKPARERRIIFCYSFTSFSELLLRTGPHNGSMHQELLTVAERLCGPDRGAYLPPPSVHLHLWLEGMTKDEKTARDVAILGTLIRDFIGAQSYDDFVTRFGSMQKGMADSLAGYTEALLDEVRYRRDRIRFRADARESFERAMSVSSLLHKNREEILAQFELADYFANAPDEEILRAAGGLLCYLELERAFAAWYCFDDVEPQPGHYFARQEAVYLDGCDYVVTADSCYKELFNRYESERLNGRAITVTDLTRHLNQPCLVPRANAG